MSNTPTDNAWLDEVLNNIDFKLKPVVIGGSKFADEIVITGKRKAKQASLTHIDTVCREAEQKLALEVFFLTNAGEQSDMINIRQHLHPYLTQLNPNKDTE